jgi:hypothetical protein
MASTTVRNVLSKQVELPHLSGTIDGLVEEAVDALSGDNRKVWFSDEGREHMSVLLRAYYDIENVSSRYARVITFCFWVVGGTLFLIPSSEVFFMVLKRLFFLLF